MRLFMSDEESLWKVTFELQDNIVTVKRLNGDTFELDINKSEELSGIVAKLVNINKGL